LQQHPESYTLSLGHLGDLTLQSFAYLRAPLVLAGVAFLVGAAGAWLKGRRAFIAFAVMMVLFLHASRMALVVFDPYLSSRPLAEALNHAPADATVGMEWAFLLAPVDLLYNGGIGTYVKSSSESNVEVGDRANDAIRRLVQAGSFDE
jgi:hypothetical protein